MSLSKKVRLAIIASAFYSGMLFIGYTDMYTQLRHYEKNYGINNTVRAAEFWLKKYDARWYLKPLHFTKEWAIKEYLKEHPKTLDLKEI